jgi:hypothetical protein
MLPRYFLAVMRMSCSEHYQVETFGIVWTVATQRMPATIESRSHHRYKSFVHKEAWHAAGASMQQGIAVPKVCRSMIPHLIQNEVRKSCADT